MKIARANQLLIGILTLIIWPSATAQSQEAIAEIKKYYYSLSEAIKKVKNPQTEEDRRGGIYCNALLINQHNASWPGVGNYQEKQEFWYEYPPDLADKPEPKAVLQKIVIESQSAAQQYYNEYVFREGQLIFYFSKASELPETRIYFKNHQLIHFRENDNIIAQPNEIQQELIKNVRLIARMYQAKFLDQF